MRREHPRDTGSSATARELADPPYTLLIPPPIRRYGPVVGRIGFDYKNGTDNPSFCRSDDRHGDSKVSSAMTD